MTRKKTLRNALSGGKVSKAITIARTSEEQTNPARDIAFDGPVRRSARLSEQSTLDQQRLARQSTAFERHWVEPMSLDMARQEEINNWINSLPMPTTNTD